MKLPSGKSISFPVCNVNNCLQFVVTSGCSSPEASVSNLKKTDSLTTPTQPLEISLAVGEVGPWSKSEWMLLCGTMLRCVTKR